MSKRVTAKQVAEELNVSIMTVSRAINDSPNVDHKTRKKVIDTARRLGYIPNQIAKSLALQKTDTIGVVVPEITHSFFPEAIRGIEKVTYSAGYHLILTHSAENAEREMDALKTLASKRVDGILISTAESVTDYKIYSAIMNLKIPIVFFDRCVMGIGASCLSVNDKYSAKKITEHLIEHKYKKIAHLCGPMSVAIGRLRLAGYKKALQDHNLMYSEDYVVESGFHESGGFRAMEKLLDLPEKKRPRAVFAVNDPAAFGAMKAILKRGLSIPQDIAIVGFSDDIRADLLPVPLTTIRQPAYEIGKKAVEKLIRHIENEEEKIDNIVIDTDIIIRKSCGCK